MKQSIISTGRIGSIALCVMMILCCVPFGAVFCQADTAAAPMIIDMTADELIKKHIQALGGEEKLAAVKDETMEGEVTTSFGSMEVEATIMTIRKTPNKSYTHTVANIMGQQQESETWCDGVHFYMSMGFGGTNKESSLTGEELAGSIEGNALNQFLHYKELGYVASIKEKKLMDGKPIYVLELKRKHGSGQFGISAESFLMVGNKREQETPGGKQLVFIRYSDYRPVDGIMYPFHLSMSLDKMMMETRVKSYKLNTNVSDDVFVKK